MSATHKSTIYKPLDVKNPFTDSSDKAFGELLQNQINETKSWKRLGAASLLLFVINFIFFVYALSRQQTVPVLINVMPSGEAQYLGEVRQNGDMQVPDAAIHFQIRTFITNLRSVSTDYQVVYQNIDDCFGMVTSNYSKVMAQRLREASPFDLVGKVRRTVAVESVLSITERSYQINWTETTLDTSAYQKSVKMRAVVTIRLLPATDATIKKNPLGIYIENCEMTEL